MTANVIYTGSAGTILPALPSESVHCCVTSPPYYGLRDYGHPDQIGLEPTVDEYILHLVQVFRGIRRVLRKDGTCWVNLGNSWNGNSAAYGDAKSTLQGTKHSGIQGAPNRFKKRVGNLKTKDLIGIPWMVAFALRNDGWYLRQDIIWHKPNPMPESVKDRCTNSHEYIFLLTKSARYWYDADAIAENALYGSKGSEFHTGKTGEHQLGRASKKRGEFNGKTNDLPGREAFRAITETRNRRSVWSIATRPYTDAHFATFPLDIPRLCISAGCPEGGIVIDPFFGAGTTGLAAMQLSRQYIGIELNPEYTALAQKRLHPSRSQTDLFIPAP